MPVVHEPEVVATVQAANPDGAMILSKSQVAVPPAARATVLKAVNGVLEISLIVPVVPKIGSTPVTRVAVVPVQGDVTPENAMQGGRLDTDSSFPDMLLRFTTPPPPSGMGVANTLGAIAITASPIEAKPATFRPIAEFLYLLICFYFFSSVSVHSGFDPGFKYAIAF